MPYRFLFRGISFNVKQQNEKIFYQNFTSCFSTNYKNIGFLYLIFEFCSVGLNFNSNKIKHYNILPNLQRQNS